MTRELNRQLGDRQNVDSKESAYLDLTVGSDQNESVTLVFADAERRASWEEAFNDVKQKLGEVKWSQLVTNVCVLVRVDDKRSPPDFLSLVPVRKTRSGLQFTCAAPTLPACSQNQRLRDVWVCNSDGYVGQVKGENQHVVS